MVVNKGNMPLSRVEDDVLEELLVRVSKRIGQYSYNDINEELRYRQQNRREQIQVDLVERQTEIAQQQARVADAQERTARFQKWTAVAVAFLIAATMIIGALELCGVGADRTIHVIEQLPPS